MKVPGSLAGTYCGGHGWSRLDYGGIAWIGTGVWGIWLVYRSGYLFSFSCVLHFVCTELLSLDWFSLGFL